MNLQELRKLYGRKGASDVLRTIANLIDQDDFHNKPILKSTAVEFLKNFAEELEQLMNQV